MAEKKRIKSDTTATHRDWTGIPAEVTLWSLSKVTSDRRSESTTTLISACRTRLVLLPPRDRHQIIRHSLHREGRSPAEVFFGGSDAQVPFG